MGEETEANGVKLGARKPLLTCRWNDTLRDAACLMWEHECACLLVTKSDSGPIAGVLTDRDICMAAYLRERGLGSLRVRDAMSTSFETLVASDALALAEVVSIEREAPPLVLVDERGELLAFLTPTRRANDAGRRRDRRQPAVTHRGALRARRPTS